MLCNKKYDEDGQANIVSVTGEKSCLPKVVMEHSSGCPQYSFKGFVKFLDENVWLSGTIMVVLGLSLVLFGRVFFRFIMGILAALVGFCAVMYLSSLFGWLEATWAMVTLIVIAVVVGLVAGWFIYASIPIGIGLLGVAAGFFGGAALYSLTLAMTGYDALWLLITLVVVGAILCGFLSFKFRMGFLTFSTSFVGGYMFMRGTTFWFGHYPSEMEMFSMMTHGETVHLEWQFWVYFATFILVSIFGFIWQTRFYKNSDSTVDDYFANNNKA